jgi:hypothetical protein
MLPCMPSSASEQNSCGDSIVNRQLQAARRHQQAFLGGKRRLWKLARPGPEPDGYGIKRHISFPTSANDSRLPIDEEGSISGSRREKPAELENGGASLVQHHVPVGGSAVQISVTICIHGTVARRELSWQRKAFSVYWISRVPLSNVLLNRGD